MTSGSPPRPPKPDHQQLLASIVESSEDAIASKTLEGVITSWNSSAERLFGYTADEAIGRSVTILIPPDRRHEEEMILSRIRRGERIQHYESVRVRKDGSFVNVALTISPIVDQDGTIVGASKIVRDISERKRSEAEQLRLREAERELREDTQALNDLAHALSGELDLHKLIQEVTDCATRLTGAQFGAFFYNAVDKSGESYVLFTLSGAAREEFESFGMPRNTLLFEPTFSGRDPVRIDDVLADPRYGKNPPHYGVPAGHLPIRSYLAVSVVSRDGQVIGGLFFGHPDVGVFTERAERIAVGIAAQSGICIDNARLFEAAQREIEVRRAAEERERAARTDAERASRLRDEFLATLSHELRTPLNSVLGWTQLLRRAPEDAEVRGKAIEAIDRGVRTQTRLIEDLLDMSRILSGKLRLDVQSIDVLASIEAAIEIVRPAADAKGVRVHSVLDPRAGPIVGDSTRIQQIVWNLVSNAVKFTPKGGRVQVLLERVNSHIEIVVSDNGRGISAEFLPHVFDRFRQADASTTRSEGGLGLGLALVKHLVELHGGRVLASSAGEGQGAKFTVQIPLAMFHQPPAESPNPSALDRIERASCEPRLGGLTILIVEDDADACEMLLHILEERGARVVAAPSARDALKRLDETQVDVIVSDIGMPGMDGYEFLSSVRARGVTAPAVAVTAFARAEDRIRAVRAGFNMHVAKPLEPDELVEVLAALTRNRT